MVLFRDVSVILGPAGSCTGDEAGTENGSADTETMQYLASCQLGQSIPPIKVDAITAASQTTMPPALQSIRRRCRSPKNT